MSSMQAPARPSKVSQALARNRLGVVPVLFFAMSSIAPLTVAAGVITSAYATTGLTGIPAAFIVIAVVLALFAAGYMAMARHITHAGALYAFISRGLGRTAGVAAALVALLAYTYLQVGLYGAFGPAAQSEAQAHLHLNVPWWMWALVAWALVTLLGLLRVDIAGKVLGVLLTAELIVTVAETVSGLAHPATGHLSFSALSPSSLGSQGWSTAGVLGVVAVLAYVGFEQAPVLGEEAKSPRRTIPAATYIALGLIALVYAGAAWAMSAHAGPSHVVADAIAQGPGIMFGLNSHLAQAAQALFMTSLFAALLSFHNCVWRYIFALAREGVLPTFLARTGANSVPKAASLAQSVTGLAVIVIYALGGWAPMSDLFFWMGTTGGFGILVLLAVTSVAVVCFFGSAGHDDESLWRRMIAPALSAVILTVIVVLAVMHYSTLLGVSPGSPVAWILPASFGVVAAIGLGWGAILRARRPWVYGTIGLGANAVTGQATPTRHRAAS